VLLGSIASDKYVELLLEILGQRLLFPVDFVGRGDMSRGGLMLRAARSGTELPYGPVQGAVRRGPRPPRLPRVAPVRRTGGVLPDDFDGGRAVGLASVAARPPLPQRRSLHVDPSTLVRPAAGAGLPGLCARLVAVGGIPLAQLQHEGGRRRARCLPAG